MGIELNKIYNVDCVKGLKLIPNNFIDFILTDPPFNVSLNYSDIEDSLDDETYSDWCFQWINELYRVLKERSYAIIFSGDKKLYYVMKAIYKTQFQFHHFLKWYKPTGQRGLSGTVFFNRTELAFVLSKGKPNVKKVNRKELYSDTIIIPGTNVNQSQDGFLVDHPAKRPTKLYRKIIKGFTDKNDLILDCFMGSGTTSVCSKQLERNYIGFEISSEYVAMAEKRLKQENLESHIKKKVQSSINDYSNKTTDKA